MHPRLQIGLIQKFRNREIIGGVSHENKNEYISKKNCMKRNLTALERYQDKYEQLQFQIIHFTSLLLSLSRALSLYICIFSLTLSLFHLVSHYITFFYTSLSLSSSPTLSLFLSLSNHLSHSLRFSLPFSLSINLLRSPCPSLSIFTSCLPISSL